MGSITFEVVAEPKPGGSKRAITHRHTGRTIVIDACKGNKAWRNEVAKAARIAWPYNEPLDCPCECSYTFRMKRPQSHFRTGKYSDQLKPSAPQEHTTRPDVTKLIRSTEDALTGILWKDDSQVTTQHATKEYVDNANNKPCAEITLEW